MPYRRNSLHYDIDIDHKKKNVHYEIFAYVPYVSLDYCYKNRATSNYAVLFFCYYFATFLASFVIVFFLKYFPGI